jgi:hypothetical protein
MTTQTYSFTHPASTTELDVSFTLPKFDTSLGILKEVHFSFSAEEDSFGTLTNTSANAADLSMKVSVAFSLAQNLNTLLSNTQSTSQSFPGAHPNDPQPFSFTLNGGDSVIFTSGPNFDLFNNGPGNVDFNFATVNTVSTKGAGGNTVLEQTTTAGFTASVFYLFVPEPTSLALLASGLLVVPFAIRRFRRPS